MLLIRCCVSPCTNLQYNSLHLISGLTFGLLGRGEPVLINSIPGDTDDGQCERLEEEVARADRDTIVEEPPRLNGKWVSEGWVRYCPDFVTSSEINCSRDLSYTMIPQSSAMTTVIRGTQAMSSNLWWWSDWIFNYKVTGLAKWVGLQDRIWY